MIRVQVFSRPFLRLFGRFLEIIDEQASRRIGDLVRFAAFRVKAPLVEIKDPAIFGQRAPADFSSIDSHLLGLKSLADYVDHVEQSGNRELQGHEQKSQCQADRRQIADRPPVAAYPVDLEAFGQPGQQGAGQNKAEKEAERKIQHGDILYDRWAEDSSACRLNEFFTLKCTIRQAKTQSNSAIRASDRLTLPAGMIKC